jgi:hypothetical protein
MKFTWSVISIYITLTTLTLVSCKKTEEEAKDFIYNYSVFGSFSGKRVFLAHGNQGQGSDYLIKDTGLRTIFDGLIAKGYQVILFDYPKTKKTTFKQAGLAYRQKYQHFLNWMINETDRVHGLATERLFGGVSLGGLHAFMAVTLNPLIQKYFAVVPVTDIRALKEFKNVNPEHFNALNEALAISQKPGLIIYGTADYRVNYNLTIDLITSLNSLGAPLDVVALSGRSHSMTDEFALEVLNWIP